MKPVHTREDLCERLAEVGRIAVERGLVLASGGNLSARLPGGDEFVVTGAGTWLDRLEEADFTVMTLAGERTGGAAKPSSEWKLHQRTYQVRPDVNCVVHLHPQHAVLLDAVGAPIRLISLDHAYYVRSVGTVPYHPNGSDELAEAAAEQALHHDCMVLSHHGCSSLGADIGMAFRRAMNLEEAAVATYRALALGDTTAAFPSEALASLHHA
ncbi:class II aldolase/adducin family protein [Streptomyces sp. SID4919]|uniref:class II aldolase/adducin family protein n=1 Tax=unclassified Streptomyces TaxID=2593676 RepID=UPI000823CA43|nr:class II aldolase/adducin family protein [Streptomyces sp. AmelKG-E11A]MYY08024.1 class II aldolase/adducin family protein [Streptomyces sp. SID4919]SCK08125.1 L-fuculose-phosphate aldolase [Streptomyces sp. AmelKG-E11A]